MGASLALTTVVTGGFMICIISNSEYTEMAWEGIVDAVEIAKDCKQQVVESEHLMKALLEHKDGLAWRIFIKAGVDNTSVLQATDEFIAQQPKFFRKLQVSEKALKDAIQAVRGSQRVTDQIQKTIQSGNVLYYEGLFKNPRDELCLALFASKQQYHLNCRSDVAIGRW
ncbi:hypothetical protein RJ639_038839 [Escallonia herrerae]|uniref:Clp R domain-containing protein n=1 Tax=Escallonia herrerae TaxID=1293975 RepID=A0AA88WMM7_9ASTE|nr:hypothetical protein RJ639_038839 [Escallonia herrerae]